MTTLYETLDVEPTAPPEEIKKAYRRKATEAHPDAGGSVEEFAAISTARDVLLNPARREKYDRTGTIEDTVDNEVAEILQMVVGLVDQVMANVEQRGLDPTCVDLIALALSGCRDQIKHCEHEIDTCKKSVALLKKIAERFKPAKDGGPNRIRPFYERRIVDRDAQRTQLEDKKRKFDEALKILKVHIFERDASQDMSRQHMYTDSSGIRFR